MPGQLDRSAKNLNVNLRQCAISRENLSVHVISFYQLTFKSVKAPTSKNSESPSLVFNSVCALVVHPEDWESWSSPADTSLQACHSPLEEVRFLQDAKVKIHSAPRNSLSNKNLKHVCTHVLALALPPPMIGRPSLPHRHSCRHLSVYENYIHIITTKFRRQTP